MLVRGNAVFAIRPSESLLPENLPVAESAAVIEGTCLTVIRAGIPNVQPRLAAELDETALQETGSSYFENRWLT
jgi:hypothetical protein